MNFAHPWLLYLIPVAVLGCHLFFVGIDRARSRRMKKFLGEAYPRYLERSGRTPLWIPQRYFLTLCFVFLLIAAARPYLRPAEEEGEMQQRVGADFIIAVDASKSMLARDTETTESWRNAYAERDTKVKGKGFVGKTGAMRQRMRQARNAANIDDPDTMSRLDASKQAIGDLIGSARGDRIGLIAFTNEAGLRAPLTYDAAALALVLESISPGTVPPGGTSLESAIKRAKAVFEDKDIKQPILVIVSDGEAHEGNAFEAAAAFRNELRGVIHTVGVGTPAGTQIRTSTGRRNQFAGDQFGQTITTRLDKLSLDRIARATGGRYVDLGMDGQGLAQLYREQIKPTGDASPAEFPPNAIELFQVPLTLALLSLICEMLVRIKAQPLTSRAILST